MPPSPPNPAAETHFQQALARHQQGDLAGALAGYEAALAADPRHFDALHLRGVIDAQTGNPAGAVEWMGRALAIDASHAVVHYNHALALRELGRLPEALGGFEHALAIDNGYTEAQAAHGDVLRALGRVPEALAAYDAALALDPRSVDTLANRAGLLQGLERHEEALAGFDAALALEPRHADALYGRGVVLQFLQRHDDALAAYSAALDVHPALVAAHANRALLLGQLGRAAEALPAYDALLALLPDNAEAWFARGRQLEALARAQEAFESYGRALSIDAAHPQARGRRGALLLARGDAAGADAELAQHLARSPGDVQAWLERAMALQSLGRLPEALACYERLLVLAPDNAAAMVNRGNTLHAAGRDDEALASYDRAIAANPHLPEAHYSRGVVLQHGRRIEEASAAYEAALTLRPDYVDALSNRGGALQAAGRFDAALADFDRVLRLAPGNLGALGNRADTLHELRRYSEAAQAYRRLLDTAPGLSLAAGSLLHVQLNQCDWGGYEAGEEIRAAVLAGRLGDVPFSFLSVAQNAAEQLACARAHAARVLPHVPRPLWQGERYGHRKIRLAYVSADLRAHAVSWLLAQVLECHDRDAFELIALSLKPPELSSAIGRRVHDAFDRFIDASALDDRAAAQALFDAQVDIAVDLGGYTSGARPAILAQRPAPVQVNFLGFAGTMGASHMDYILADAVVIPPGEEPEYAEQVARLPGSFMPRDAAAPRVAPLDAATRARERVHAGLPAQGFVFCCFNVAYKFNPPVWDIWMRLLREVPGSVLWLPENGTAAAENLRREAAARGVDPARLVFAAKTPELEDHIARLPLANLFLDTLPYNAHTTASDALWAGLPLLTRAGQAFAGRVAASLLDALGLPELVTRSVQEYESMALRLAREPALLESLRTRLARNARTHLPFDNARYTRNLEAAYKTMHERARRSEAPRGFTVPGN